MASGRVRPRISDYELLRCIGQGSYGDVWLARGVTGLYRAVKVIWRDRFKDSGPYEREFAGLREFAAISLIERRQLALLHVGRNDAAGFFYYVMELADDIEAEPEIDPVRYTPWTLKEMRERRGRLPTEAVISLAIELTEGLGELHARGLVHRDIKPPNVIFVAGRPRLADIGLVAPTTAADRFVGTAGFVAPEGSGTPTADIFSLGKLIYEVATGLDRHDYPRLPPGLAEMPDRARLIELNEILLRACAHDPAHRYADAAALLADLKLLEARRATPARRRAFASPIRIAALLAIGAIIAGGAAAVPKRNPASIQNESNVSKHAPAVPRMENSARRFCLSDDGRRLAFARESGRIIEIIDIGSFQRLGEILDAVQPVAFTEHGTVLIVRTPSGMLERRPIAVTTRQPGDITVAQHTP